ncbi:general secretion pathway protein GspB [Aquimonas voraii]|uniref:Type II secretion system protein B n=1 Tax=Aquimonas voraii TaxID=265719 RepID=A0A1G6XMT1_9GAMM|nr:general secretion pathway protein GspB [Aquimonas voraii]SDD79063.1 Type II secretion system protein B [Aquimonas voraii]
MSLILEALKKSEAERLRGRVPGLLDLQPRAPRRRTRSWPLALAAALLLGAAGGAYLWLQRTPSPADPPTAGVATSAAYTSAESVQTAAARTESESQTPGDPEPRPPAVPAAVEQASAPPASRLPSDPSFASIEREARPQLAVALPAHTPTAATPAPPALAPAPPAPVQPAPAPAQLPADATADTAVASANLATLANTPPAGAMDAPAAAPIEVAATVPPAADTPPLLSSLGHEARGRLPPLKVSMHVFAEDPAARVVIIDGRRLREGDAIDSTLRLAEIRREGSVLELDGRRYLLPRP